MRGIGTSYSLKKLFYVLLDYCDYHFQISSVKSILWAFSLYFYCPSFHRNWSIKSSLWSKHYFHNPIFHYLIVCPVILNILSPATSAKPCSLHKARLYKKLKIMQEGFNFASYLKEILATQAVLCSTWNGGSGENCEAKMCFWIIVTHLLSCWESPVGSQIFSILFCKKEQCPFHRIVFRFQN